MTTPARPEDVQRAYAALGQYLQHLKEEGARQIELDPRHLAALRQARARPDAALAPRAAPVPPARTAVAPRAPAPAPAEKAGPPDYGASDAGRALQEIAARVAACRQCRLCQSRTQVVPGQGHLAPDLMFIGEGPGADEDRQGLAFVGRAGQLLTDIIAAMGLTRDEVFIGNVVKCRPPDNRTPMPDEMAACLPYLKEQIALLKPKIIVALGGTAVKGLFNDPKIGITKIRGTWMTYEGIDVMPTFHPAFLLRDPRQKRPVWEDMKAVLRRLGREPPKKPAV